MIDLKIKKDLKIKEERLLNFLDKNNYDAMVIGRQDNFSWITCGGSNHLIITSEIGFCILIITKRRKYIIANTMDGLRILEEQMNDLNYELITLKWFEKSKEDTALELIRNKRVISDISLDGTVFNLKSIYDLHFPLTAEEMKKYKWLSNKSEEVIRKITENLKPGITELEVETLLIQEYAKFNITPVVILVGSDYRINRYRHPTSTKKKIEKILMVSPTVRKWGIHAPITRMVFFGNTIPKKVGDKFDAVCNIEAHVFAKCKPGEKFIDIFEMQKILYKELGFQDEWQKHFQGGITGYFPNDPTQCLNSRSEVRENQTFNWYITITGAKVEEVFTSNGEILSSNGLWPTKKYEAFGNDYDLPQILTR